MTTDLVLFFILAAISIVSALGMLTSKNAVYAALNLVLNFVTVAIFYLLLDSPFIALSQVTVYAGAIMVLFLFVIMLLGAEQIQAELQPKDLTVPIVLGVVLLIEGGYLLLTRIGASPTLGAAGTDLSDPFKMASKLYSEYLLPFEVTSILLLVAMVGAIVLTKKEKGGERK